jgi:hypothetical protein
MGAGVDTCGTPLRIKTRNKLPILLVDLGHYRPAVECFFRNYGTSFRFIVELEAQTCVVISIIPNKEGNKF